MISETCSIDEFVAAVKSKESWEVIALAIDEATQADRMAFRNRRRTNGQSFDFKTYSRRLKRLINYLRYEIKPHRPEDRAYALYVAHWGITEQDYPGLLMEGAIPAAI